MTAHCATCTCADGALPQPSTSSPGIRRMALAATRAAVTAARTRRTTVEKESEQ